MALAEEMHFLDAYRYLLGIRFGAALQWEINIDEWFRDYWLPPLTLQTLIENALRHNSLLPEQPLTLHLSVRPENVLVVCNAIRRKKTALLASKGGLAALSARFESLGLPGLVIEDDGRQFTVRVPLLQKEKALGLSTPMNPFAT